MNALTFVVNRLESFSDGVIAILITIMVLELRTPHGTTWTALRQDLPVLLAYLLSSVNIGIYWNNHHHTLAVPCPDAPDPVARCYPPGLDGIRARRPCRTST